jgi:transcriptional regulator NrdR family protein
MAKKVFNKRIHRIRRKLQRRELKEVSKTQVHEKVLKALNKANK